MLDPTCIVTNTLFRGIIRSFLHDRLAGPVRQCGMHVDSGDCDVSLHSPRFPQLDISLWFFGESKLGQGPKAAMFGGDRSGVMDVITSSGVTPSSV